MSIPRDSLLSLEAYAKIRSSSRAQAIAHRRLRSVPLGAHMTLQFEDEQTIRRQIQEMLHVEKIFDEAGIQAEIDAYAPLLPDGSDWKATLLIEYAEVDARRQALARLRGVATRVYVEIAGSARVYAIADEDLEREDGQKTSAVHFLRFAFDAAQRHALRAGVTAALGCDHAHYRARTELAGATRASLVGDLSD